MPMTEITLHTGRKVMKGLHAHDANYRGRLLGKRSMVKQAVAPPSSCLQSAQYYLNIYFNATYGCCTGSALVEIINMVYGVIVPQDVALAWFKAHHILNGADELTVLTSAETDPLTVSGTNYVIGPSATLDYTDPVAIQSAIAFHKCVYWGVDAAYLEKCVGNDSGWVAPIITRDQTNYDHAVFSPDYGTLDECAKYINEQRGVTVTIGSLDPSTPCCTLDTWGTLGIVPMQTIEHTTGEAHVIESFPNLPTPVPPGPVPPGDSITIPYDAAQKVNATLTLAAAQYQDLISGRPIQ